MTGDTLDEVLRQRRSCRNFSDRPVSMPEVLQICRAAQGVTGPDGKRSAPSANNMHPLKLVVSLGRHGGRAPAVHSFEPELDSLTETLDRDARLELAAAALGDQRWLSRAFGIATLFADVAALSEAFADQPPKGARGERYAYIEAGAAAQNAMLAATSLGLGSVLVAGFDDEATTRAFRNVCNGRPLLHVGFGWPSGTC